MRQAERSQAFFVLTGLTKPKNLVGDNEDHDDGY